MREGWVGGGVAVAAQRTKGVSQERGIMVIFLFFFFKKKNHINMSIGKYTIAGKRLQTNIEWLLTNWVEWLKWNNSKVGGQYPRKAYTTNKYNKITDIKSAILHSNVERESKTKMQSKGWGVEAKWQFQKIEIKIKPCT